jgi:hypothetical protein
MGGGRGEGESVVLLGVLTRALYFRVAAVPG